MNPSGFFPHAGINFHYRDIGSGVPFLFQHGLGGDHTQTAAVCTPPSGIRLLTLDCRAHGETRPVGPEDQLSIQQFVEDAAAFLDHLKLESVILGGISMGAALSLEFALRFPDRVHALILSRPAWLDAPRPGDFSVFARISEWIRRYGPHEGAERFRESEAFLDLKRESPDNAQSMLNQFLHPRAAETVARLDQIPRYQPAFSRSDWAHIHVPTLVLGNRQDRIHPFDYAVEMARIIPGAAFRELPPKSSGTEHHVREHKRILDEFLSKSLQESSFIPSSP